MNRQMRRAGKSIHKKQIASFLSKNEWGEWEDMTFPMRNKFMIAGKKTDKFIGFFKNNIYSVQIYKSKNDKRFMGIRRHDESIDIPWKDKQKIKNELIGPEFEMVEVFPNVDQLVDQANMFWLWECDCTNTNLKKENFL